jgi:hypothetical protein
LPQKCLGEGNENLLLVFPYDHEERSDIFESRTISGSRELNFRNLSDAYRVIEEVTTCQIADVNRFFIERETIVFSGDKVKSSDGFSAGDALDSIELKNSASLVLPMGKPRGKNPDCSCFSLFSMKTRWGQKEIFTARESLREVREQFDQEFTFASLRTQ